MRIRNVMSSEVFFSCSALFEMECFDTFSGILDNDEYCSERKVKVFFLNLGHSLISCYPLQYILEQKSSLNFRQKIY